MAFHYPNTEPFATAVAGLAMLRPLSVRLRLKTRFSMGATGGLSASVVRMCRCTSTGSKLPVAPISQRLVALFREQPHGARRSFALASVMVLLLLLPLGCGSGDQNTTSTFDGPLSVTREANQGTVSLKLAATTDDLGLSDHLQVRFEVIADSDVTVADMDYQAVLSEGDRAFEYRVVLKSEESARPLGDGRLRWMLEYDIEFFLPGDYELPPAEVHFVRAPTTDTTSAEDETAGVERTTLSTAGIAIMVRAPADVLLSEEELRKITRLDPIDLPPQSTAWTWITPLIVVAGLIFLGILIRRRRRTKAQAVIVIPAHEWAKRELGLLVQDDLIHKGLVQEFYYRISGIVRGYIERRFAVSAPEMTTEEFLAAASMDRRFGHNTTQELDKFLVACDLVKYAAHRPGFEDSQAVLRAAGEFVEQTQEGSPDSIQANIEQPRQEGQAA